MLSPTTQTSRSEHPLTPKKAARAQDREAPAAASAHSKHNRGLLLIGLFKLGKFVLFFLLGLGAMKLLHKDLADLLLQAAAHWKFDPESRFILLLLEKAQLIDDHRLVEISIGTFSYSGVALVEGIGLVLEKRWAEYFTLTLSVLFLPWEFYELVLGVTMWRVLITASNVLIVLYLLWFLRQLKRAKAARASRQG